MQGEPKVVNQSRPKTYEELFGEPNKEAPKTAYSHVKEVARFEGCNYLTSNQTTMDFPKNNHKNVPTFEEVVPENPKQAYNVQPQKRQKAITPCA